MAAHCQQGCGSSCAKQGNPALCVSRCQCVCHESTTPAALAEIDKANSDAADKAIMAKIEAK